MRYAIISDIHNNTAALQAVISHAETQHVDGYFCLGDVGIDACVDLVRHVNAPTVFGNWEVSGWQVLLADNQRWALSLPPMIKREGFWLTHAGPFWPSRIDTLSTLNRNRYQLSMRQLFPYFHHESEILWEAITTLLTAEIPLMFHGHTHRQMVWRFTAENQLQKLNRQSIALRPDDTLIIGVGSVGRPEDGTGAAYVIYDDALQQVAFHRVEV